MAAHFSSSSRTAASSASSNKHLTMTRGHSSMSGERATTTWPPVKNNTNLTTTVEERDRAALLEAEEKLREGDLGGAEAAYDRVDFARAVDADVTFQAHNNRGALRMRRGKLIEAAADFEAALTLRPRSADAWYNLGAVRSKAGDLDKALFAFDRGVALGAPSRRTNVYPCACGVAETLASLGRFDDAVAAARAAVSLDPSRSRGHAALGSALLEAPSSSSHPSGAFRPSCNDVKDSDSKNAAAADAFEAAMRAGDASSATRRLAALAASLDADARARRKEYDGAIHQYERALGLLGSSEEEEEEPKNTTGESAATTMRYNYALTLINRAKHNTPGGSRERDDEAVRQLKLVVSAEPDHAEARNALGLLLLRRGASADASAHLERASNLAPDDAERRYNYGVSLFKARHHAKAAAVFREMLVRHPDHAPAADALDVVVRENAKKRDDDDDAVKKASTLKKYETKHQPPATLKTLTKFTTTVAASSVVVGKERRAFVAAQTDSTTTTPAARRRGPAVPTTTTIRGSSSYPVYPYDALRAPGPFPDDVRVGEREMHLSDEDFVRVMGVTKEVFARQPKWKQDSKKRECRLF